ncbi:hypothetical protein BH23CHL5_BH23CHL5_02710 [soil metagenome]
MRLLRLQLPLTNHEVVATSTAARRGRKWLLATIMLIWLLIAGQAIAVAQTQPEAWTSVSNDEFIVLMQPNDRLSAESFSDAYGDFIAAAMNELTLLFNTRSIRTPVTFMVFSNVQQFESAAAAASPNEFKDILAIAAPEHSSILIPLSKFISLTPFEAENQLRHALAHVVLGEATGSMIPRGFDEGFARYFERPNQPALAKLASIVQTAHRDGKLASWSNMNRNNPLDDDALIEAQAYAAVGYLLEHYGLPAFRVFLDELQTAETWRDAMKVAYSPGTSDTIERQWRDEIPLWIQGDWKWNLVAGFDFGRASDLLARGNFEGAAGALLVSEQLLADINDPARKEQVARLKDEARIGGLAEAKMAEAQQALEIFAYDRAAAAVDQADEQYSHLPLALRPTDLIAEYRFLASVGLKGTEELELARIRAGSWGNYPEARASALSAGTGFALLGDSVNHQDSQLLIEQMDNTQLRLVLLLGALALLTIAWLVLWLWYREPDRLRWNE